MKKRSMFYLINMLWIICFFILAYQENKSVDVGLAALESVGHFYLYALLLMIGILVMVIATIINIILWIRKKKYR